MSYSIGNVLKEAGLENIMRWIPLELTEDEVMGIIYNKMIRPTTIPMTLEDLIVEHAVARESIRMAFNHHKYLARELKGVKRERTISDIFEEVKAEETYIDMKRVNYIIGTGGLLSRAPRRAQSMMILIDTFQPIFGEAISIDYVVEPFRATMIPFYSEMKKLALSEGAYGFNISGAGPSVFIVHEDIAVVAKIGEKVKRFLNEKGVEAHTFVSYVSLKGAEIVEVVE